MTIIQAKPQARIYPTKLSPNLYLVQDGQTIQAVIDTCPVAAGNLKDGFTNPQTVRVPPGHEKEHYSLVRDAADAASDKRNVKVIFEDNPEGKFQLESYDKCETTTGWSAHAETALSLDTEHKTEGENCLKMVNSALSSVTIWKEGLTLDGRGYQGLLMDVEINTSEIENMRIYFWDSISPDNYLTVYHDYLGSSGVYKGQVFVPLWHETEQIDLSNIIRIDFRFKRKTGYTGTITGYIDNIRLIKTFPCNVAILRFDDGLDEHWTTMKYLDEKGWKGSYGVCDPVTLGAANRLSLPQIQNMNNAGHDIINHTIEHPNFKNLNLDETYYNFYGMHKWLQDNGFFRGVGKE